MALSVKELRARLATANVSTEGCVEKADLLRLYEQTVAKSGSSAAADPMPDVSDCPPPTTTTTTASFEAAPAAAAAPTDTSAAGAAAWEELSTLNLKKLLRSHGISTDGCDG